MSRGKKVFQYVFLSTVSLLSVFPLYYMFCGATNRSTDVVAGRMLPGGYIAQNMKALLENQDLARALWNSFRNAVILTLLALLVCSIAGYGFEIIMIRVRI